MKRVMRLSVKFNSLSNAISLRILSASDAALRPISEFNLVEEGVYQPPKC